MTTPPSHTPRVPDVTPDPPGVPWRAVLKLLGRLPQGALSRGLGALADTPVPGPMRGLVLGTFARAVGIDVDEAERPLDEYGSVNDFFVRRLKAGARTWPADPGLVSPVDGVVGRVGRIEDGRLIQAKGLDYAATDLLGSAEEAARFDGGRFITIYLSPKHYHRIHAPAEGTIPAARYVPGSLFPVNDAAVRHVRDLFARNERLLAHIDGDLGRVAIVAVGAYNVGRISAAFDPAWSGERAPGSGRPWVTNRTDTLPRERVYAPPKSIGRGDELMAFHLGSTVVMLTEPGQLTLEPRCVPGNEVRLGAMLATPAR